jgi:hypothetical protein
MRSGCRMEQPYGAGYDRKDSCASEAEGEEQAEASDDLAPEDAREDEHHDRDKDVHFRFLNAWLQKRCPGVVLESVGRAHVRLKRIDRTMA